MQVSKSTFRPRAPVELCSVIKRHGCFVFYVDYRFILARDMMGPHIARLSLFALQIFQLISLAAAGAVYLQLQLSHRRHLLPHPFRYLSRERRFCDFAKIVMLVLGIVHVNVVQARSCYGSV